MPRLWLILMSLEQKRAKHSASSAGSSVDCFDLSLGTTSNTASMQETISAEILEQCRLNDRKAQRYLYERLFSGAMKVCKRYSSHPEEAMEMLNAGFLKVFTQIDKYNHKGSFEGWVHRIMVNTALDYLRNEKKYRDLFVNTDTPAEIAEESYPDQMETMDVDLDIIYGMIGELPPASRMVFNLYVFENFSHNEISQETGITVGTSKWHLNNARKMLQEKLYTLMPILRNGR